MVSKVRQLPRLAARLHNPTTLDTTLKRTHRIEHLHGPLDRGAWRRVEGLAHNLLGIADERSVVAAASEAHPPTRFAFQQVRKLDGESDAQCTLWRQMWPRVDLSAIDGFPAWEAATHGVLHSNFASLTAVFCAHTSHEKMVRTMGESDWASLVAAAAPGERLPASLVFSSVASKAGLSLQRFLQAICVLADVWANPSKRAHLQWSVAAAAAEASGSGEGAAVEAAAAAVDTAEALEASADREDLGASAKGHERHAQAGRRRSGGRASRHPDAEGKEEQAVA